MWARLVLLGVLAWSLAGRAAELPGFELERLALNPGARETMGLATGDLLPARAVRLSLWGHYQHAPLVFTVDGQPRGDALGYRTSAHLIAAWGVTSWAEVSLVVPVVVAQAGEDLSAYGYERVPTTAMGAPWLGGRWAIVRQDEGRPLDLALQAAVSVPLGWSAALTRDAGAGVAGRLQVGAGRTFFDRLRLGLELGVRLRAVQAVSAGVEVGSGFVGGVALSSAGHALRGELSFRGEIPFVRSPASAEVLLGARYAFLDGFEVSLLGGPGFGKAPGTPAFRVLLGATWRWSFTPEPASEPPEG